MDWTGLIGVIVGAVLSAGGFGVREHWANQRARSAALNALRTEFDLVEEVGREPKSVAFRPMPTDAYRQALAYVSTLDQDVKKQVLNAGLAISAYNASAEFFNTQGALDRSWQPRTEELAIAATERAAEARDSLPADP